MGNDKIGLSFSGDSFKAFNVQLNDFVKISKKVDQQLVSMGTKFGNAERKLDGFTQSFEKFINSINDMNRISKKIKFDDNFIKIIDSLGGGRASDFSKFAKGMDTFTASIINFTSSNIDFGRMKKQLNDFADAFTNISTKTEKSGGIFGFFQKEQKVNVGFFDKLFSIFNKIGTLDIENFSRLSVGMKSITDVFRDIQTMDMDKAKVKNFQGAMETLFKVLEPKKLGIFAKAGRVLANVGTGGIFGRLFPKRGGIFEALKNIDFSSVSKFSELTKSFSGMSKLFNQIKNFNIDTASIKKFNTAMQEVFKGFTGRRSFLKIRGFRASFFKELEGLNASALGKLEILVKSIRRMSNVFRTVQSLSLSPQKAQAFLEQSKAIIAAFSQTSRLGRAGGAIAGITKAMGKIGILMGKGLAKGAVPAMAKATKLAAEGSIKAAEKVYEISSPSKVFLRMGKNLGESLGKGFKAAMKAIRSAFELPTKIAQAFFKKITSPLSFIKDRFVFTFRDIQRTIGGFFKGAIGNTIAFESAFTGVLKTLDTSAIFQAGGQTAVDQFTNKLQNDLLDLSTNADSLVSGLEDGFVRLSGIAELAGQLGVGPEDVAGFTDVIGQLSLATDLTDEAGAFFLAKFTNITGTQNFEQLGSAIVNLGNNIAATESQIAAVAQRIVAAGSAAGLSEAEILGWSGAIRASGLNAEAGSTSFIKFTSVIAKSVASGEQEIFGDLLGITNEEFKDLFENDPNKIFTDLIGSLGRLSRTEMLQFEEASGLTGIRLDQFVAALSRAEENSGVLTDSMRFAEEGMQEFGDTIEEYNKLQEESARRAATTASLVARMKNTFKSLSNTIGKFIQPAFNAFVKSVTATTSAIDKFLQKVGGFGVSQVEQIEETNVLLDDRVDIIDKLNGLYDDAGDSVQNFAEHQFEAGDTLSALAEEYGTTVEEILELNNMTLEDFMGNVSSVKIPTGFVDDLTEVEDKFSGIRNQAGPAFGEAVQQASNMEIATESLKTSLNGVKEGFLAIFSGDVTGGFDALKTNIVGIKDSLRDMMTEIIGGSAEENLEGVDFAEMLETGEEIPAAFDVDEASFIDMLIRTFDVMFGFDLQPVKDFISNNVGLIVGAAFGLLTKTPIALAVPFGSLLIDIIENNFGDIETLIEGSPFLNTILDAGKKLGEIIQRTLGEAFGDLTGGEALESVDFAEMLETGEIIPEEETFADRIANSIKVLFSGAGEAATVIGLAIGDLFVEGMKAVPDLTAFIISDLITPFISGVVEQLKSIDNVNELGDAIKTLFGLTFAGLVLGGVLTGGGIVGSIAGALSTMFSAAMALLNPVTIIAAGVAFIGGMILSEDFRNQVGDTLRDFFADALDFESTEEFMASIQTGLVNLLTGIITPLVQFFNEIRLWWEIAKTDILLGIEDIKALAGQRNEQFTQEQKERREALEIERNLVRALDNQDEFSAFFEAGGDILDLEASGAAIEETFGVNPKLIIDNLDTFIADIGTRFDEGGLTVQESVNQLLDAGFDEENIKAFFAERGISDLIQEELVRQLTIDPEKFRELLTSGDTTFATLDPRELIDVMLGVQEGEFGLAEIQEMFPDLDISMITVGEQIGDGLTQGLENSTGEGSEYQETISGLGDETEQLLWGTFEIKSPSEMTKRIGKDLIDGLVLGIDSNIRFLQPVMNKLTLEFQRVRKEVQDTAAAIAGFMGGLGLTGGSTLTQLIGLFGGNRQFGGDVQAGRVYEILENNLPFELFRTANQTFFMPNQPGTILSPAATGNLGAGAGATNVSNSSVVQITVPVSFQTVPTATSQAEIDSLSEAIAGGVRTAMEDSLRETTLTDKLTQKGRI
jgi:TP901 family phage tail tape measure protein